MTRYWQDGTLVMGQQFEYGFDDIGNRTTTSGRASAVSNYTRDRLNRYGSRTVAGVVDVLGIANPTANVTVGVQGQPATVASRQGEYFHHPQSVPNATAAQYPTLETKSQLMKLFAFEILAARTAKLLAASLDQRIVAAGRFGAVEALPDLVENNVSPSGDALLGAGSFHESQLRRTRTG